MTRSTVPLKATKIACILTALSIGALSGTTVNDRALAWGSGGSGGGGAGGSGGGSASGGARLPVPVSKLTDEDRDSLDRALADAELIQKTRGNPPGKDSAVAEAELQKILIALGKKGYEADPEYVAKIQQIKNAVGEGGAPAAPNAM
jgi:hypothetical protein